MRVLVTGGSGFLGLNVLQHLAVAHPDATLIVADLHRPEPEEIAQLDCAGRIAFHSLDVRDPRACLDLAVRSRPTLVIHAAAVTVTDETASESIRSVNLQGTENLLTAATATGSVQRCLLLSSSGIYLQSCDDAVCDEEHPLRLDNAYAQAKREAEALMRTYEVKGGFPIVAARIGPVYGPFERSRPTRPQVSLVRRLLDFLNDHKPVRIAGTDMSRDWTHAADIAAALDAMLCCRTLNHRIYNVSSGKAVSARDIVEAFIERGLRVAWTGEGEADIVLDARDSRKPLIVERLQRETGFRPRFDFRAGLADILAREAARRSTAIHS